MGLKEANIILDNPHNTYYAGQTVTGRVEFVFDSPKKVRGIQVKFRGQAHTEWMENKREVDAEGKEQSLDTMNHADEEYFTIQYYLLGSNTGSEIEIPAGKQTYSFQCALPPVLPSSFEGQFGYIRYTIVVILDRPWKFNQETKTAFTVINPLDLNLNPSYRKPIHMQLEKSFCCLCCASAPLSVDVSAPVSGYCPGQVIPITIEVENKSNVQLHLVKISLRKVVTYRATSPTTSTKKTKDVILTIQEGPAPAGTDKHWTLNMEVPPIPPSNLVNCNIIDLDYDLKVECVVSGMHMNLSKSSYVTIGTVPLVGGQVAPSAPQPPQIDIRPPADNTGDNAGGWVAPGTVQPPPYQSLYPSLTDPVYLPSTNTARTLKERGESNYVINTGNNFAPYYPTFAGINHLHCHSNLNPKLGC